MKLKNKKTGEIGYLLVGKGSDYYIVTNDEWEDCGKYKSLAELNEEWEDAPDEERKEYWCIDWTGGVNKIIPLDSSHDKYEQNKKEIGNYFGTEEEAELAVQKLKAWKRLKDKGFKLINYSCPLRKLYFEVDGGKFFEASGEVSEETRTDLTLLFGGEE